MAEGYVCETVSGCSLLFALPGESGIPVSALQSVARRHGRGCVMDTDMARIHGAVIVAGKPEDLARLREAPETVRKAGAIAARLPATLSAEAMRWAVHGEQGLSSQTLFRALAGVGVPGAREEISNPHDISDVRRCLLLIEQVPEFQGRLAEMAALSPEWGVLAEIWDRLAATIGDEAPGWRGHRWSAPRSAAMISEALGRAAGGQQAVRNRNGGESPNAV